MKRHAAFVGATLTALLGAVSVAGPFAGFAGAFGPAVDQLTRAEAAADSAAMFARIDIDRSGNLDIDEFAAQAVVQAELARLNRLVVLDGENVRHIPLPRAVGPALSANARVTLDAVARQQFFEVAIDKDGVDGAAYTKARLAAFDAVDRDRDRVLTGRELSRYAARLAGGELTGA